MPDSCTFPKSSRLRKRADFVRLFDAPHKFNAKGFLVVWQPNDLAEARLGITVSKKVGNAVIRNRIKRYAREIFRCCRQALPPVDINVIARRESALMDFSRVKPELERSFRHIGVPSCSRALRSS
ncbi:ribonuclease P protein component [Geobacter sp. SVR]|uniref:ribonuclease P protein component n=1 Tax=Geobacter sp. SVR TaxID=2495594 RepID=UPI0015633F4D|nr:ribonuclease P protein component [Geobacter sp. SVR]